MTQAAMPTGNTAVILCAEDDPDDRVLLRDAAAESRFGRVEFVEDGEQALAYLRRQGPYADPERSPRPSIVLLDLNMPRIDGRQVLETMKRDEALRSIPVVILTTSSAERDVSQSYKNGANSYISKPVTYAGLVRVADMLRSYWLETVELPPGTNA